MSQNQNQSNYSSQSKQTETVKLANHNLKQLHAASGKRGKTPLASHDWLLVLLLIDWKSAADFAG